VQDVLFGCADGLSGFGQAIEAAFPQAMHQTCVVHLLLSALRFVSWPDRRRVSAALREVYPAEDEQAPDVALGGGGVSHTAPRVPFHGARMSDYRTQSRLQTQAMAVSSAERTLLAVEPQR
jgi:hypothetical protein